MPAERQHDTVDSVGGVIHDGAMGYLVYGMLQSLDGYIADVDGELTLPVPGPALHRYFNEQQRQTVLSIYGRKLWDMMQYWADPDDGDDPAADEFAQEWQATPIVVVSTTLTKVPPGVRLISTDVVDAIRALKDDVDGRIEVGGAQLAATLGRAGLIDEYALSLQPVVLGAGTPYFADGFTPDLEFVGSEALDDGVVLARYVPRR